MFNFVQQSACIHARIVFKYCLFISQTQRTVSLPVPVRMWTIHKWKIIKLMIIFLCNRNHHTENKNHILKQDIHVFDWPKHQVIWFKYHTCIPIMLHDKMQRIKRNVHIYLLISTVMELRPGDDIWGHRSRSTLTQVMACCLTAPSHYLSQCLPFINKVLWHSPKTNFIGTAKGINS